MPENGSDHVRIEYDGRRADVIIDRPEKRNAMNETTVAELTAAVERVDGDDEVRAVTLLGSGPAFCAGFQLDMMYEKSAEEQDEFQRAFRALLNAIDRSTTPTSPVSRARASPAGSN
ncbi:enoyl-CoA hydratase/isomerase family protein [Halomarina halobia]|uniref:Enoyl-CoA hydratase/isomerase family protein n=1 Tax=Halomarina halobia TaxID=3033386 RepID=A0ABD6AEG1_9EURY